MFTVTVIILLIHRMGSYWVVYKTITKNHNIDGIYLYSFF